MFPLMGIWDVFVFRFRSSILSGGLMFLKYSLSAMFLLSVLSGCGDGAASSTSTGGGAAAPAEAPIEPVKSADDPSTP